MSWETELQEHGELQVLVKKLRCGWVTLLGCNPCLHLPEQAGAAGRAEHSLGRQPSQNTCWVQQEPGKQLCSWQLSSSLCHHQGQKAEPVLNEVFLILPILLCLAYIRRVC